MSRKTFTKDFKLQIVQELQAGKTAAQISQEHNIKEDLAWAWRHKYNKDPIHAFGGKGNPSTQQTREGQLVAKIGQLYLENDFLKKVNSDLQARFVELKKNVK